MYEYKALVTKIIDGDTIEAKVDIGFYLTTTLRFRLLGIDTPEKFGETKELGLKIKEYVGSRILNKEVIIITYKADAFGRWLAEVFIDVDGISFNQELLNGGFAEVYNR